MTRSLFNHRTAYRPFWYPWAYDAFKKSEQMHWLVAEVPMTEDVNDWKNRLDTDEQHLVTQIFRFFTQADCDVATGYLDKYIPKFKPTEIRMMLSSFAAREAVHIEAYSTLIDEIGMPESEYGVFTQYEAMVDKHEFLFAQSSGDDLEDLARDLAVFSAFGEGLQLFSSFVILLNFTRFGKMKGMGQVIAWSIRDESLHVDSMIKLWHELREEVPRLKYARIEDVITQCAHKMVALEDAFIDMAYGAAVVDGLTPGEVKRYIRYMADKRLLQLGFRPAFGVKKNPLPWVDVIVNGKEHSNFFETRATDYAKGSIDWSKAFND